MNESRIISRIEPDEQNRNNINQVATYENHLHSTIYRLLHTQAHPIIDGSLLYFEDGSTYIGSELDEQPFCVEAK